MVSCKFVQNLKHNFSHINISFTVGQKIFVLVWNKLSEVFYSLKQSLMPIFVLIFVEEVGDDPVSPLSNVVGHAQVERELLQRFVVHEEVPHGGWNI